MTKKELNAIKTAAYHEWEKGEDAKEALKCKANNDFYVFMITELGKTTCTCILTHRTQMNKNLLENNNFTSAANVKYLFVAHRHTKTLDF